MIYYPVPLHLLPVYDNHQSLPVAEHTAREVLGLPLWPGINELIMEQVVKAMGKIARDYDGVIV